MTWLWIILAAWLGAFVGFILGSMWGTGIGYRRGQADASRGRSIL